MSDVKPPVKYVYIVTTMGRQTGRLYQRLHAAKKLARHYDCFPFYRPVKILAFPLGKGVEVDLYKSEGGPE
jgi:hypothetical protein